MVLVQLQLQKILKNLLNVKTITIDDLVKIHNMEPNFIKLDIEGAEFDALQGSLNVLNLYHPNICIECTDIIEFDKINNLLKNLIISHIFL